MDVLFSKKVKIKIALDLIMYLHQMDVLYLNVLSAKNNNILGDYTTQIILLKVSSTVTHAIIM